MKRFLLLLLAVSALLAIAPSPVSADWTNLGGGLYSDGAYVWRAWYNCGWHYSKLYPVPVAVAYTPNWRDKVIDLIGQREDRESFESVVGALGYKASASTGQYANAGSGFSVLQQGYAPGLVTGGQTLYGVSSNVAIAQPVDVTGLIHEAQRLADRTLGLSESATAGASQLVAQAVDGNSKSAQILASAQVAAAAIQAANPATTETKVWENHPASPPPNDRPPPPQPEPPQSQPGDGANNFRAMGSLAISSCIKCHSGPAAKGGLRLGPTAIAALSPDEKAHLAEEIDRRINLPADDPAHMPKGGKMLPAQLKHGLLAMFVQQ